MQTKTHPGDDCIGDTHYSVNPHARIPLGVYYSHYIIRVQHRHTHRVMSNASCNVCVLLTIHMLHRRTIMTVEIIIERATRPRV